jgi:IS5 family transposase
MMPGKSRAFKKSKNVNALTDKFYKIKASIQGKVEHPFRVIKGQFGYREPRYRGLVKNAAQLITLLASSNLWLVRQQIILEPAG